MKRLLCICAALALLVGCKQAEPILSASATASSATSIATLASTGTCEMDIAVDMTALYLYRSRAAAMLKRGDLSLESAKRVQAMSDSARADLDAACPDAKATLDVARRDSARATLNSIQSLMETGT